MASGSPSRSVSLACFAACSVAPSALDLLLLLLLSLTLLGL